MKSERKRQNGVDQALSILSALIESDRPLAAAELAKRLGIARTSFYRIVRTLAAAGVLRVEGGRVAVGPIADLAVASYVAQTERDDQRRTSRLPRRPASRKPIDESSYNSANPLTLTRPMAVRRNRRFRIAFSNASMSNPWRIALVHSVESAAANLGEKLQRLSVRHAGDDAMQQAEDIEAFIKEGVDGLIVSAADPRLSSEPIQMAMKEGIPTIVVDRGLKKGVPHTCFVSADDRLIGEATALWLAESIRGQGKVVLLSGREDAEPARERLAAARRVLDIHPGIEIAMHAWTDWQRDAGRTATAFAIERWGDEIAGVWADSGLQGVGAIEAFIAAGRAPGAIPPHTGGDLNLCYKLALRNKVRLAAVDYPPSMGLFAVETLYAAMRGQWVPSRVAVRSEVTITRGHASRSVRPDQWAEDHVRWDLPDDLVLASGLGQHYNPRSFRVHYPGNRYNRSAASILTGAHAA